MLSLPLKASKRIIIVLSVCLLIIASPAEAITAQVTSDTSLTNITQSIKSTISAAAETISANANVTILGKDIALDKIAWNIGKRTLKQITTNTIRWINSGFNGSPAFVTDLGAHLETAVDEEVGDFIENHSSLSFLCSPFELDIRVALSVQYYKEKDRDVVSCTLSDVTDNIDGFLAGNFEDGGWAGWFEITTNPINSPAGAYFAAKAEVDDIVLKTEDEEKTLLSFGDGFKSFKVCDESGKNCDITLPGKTLADRFNASLGYGDEALIEADEINEIIGALFNQLSTKILGPDGLGGLLQGGFSGGGSSGSGSYIDALEAEEIPSGNSLTGADLFDQARNDELKYIAFHIDFIDIINETREKSEVARANSVVRDEDTGEVTTCYALNEPVEVIQFERRASSTISSSLQALTILEELSDAYQATTSPETHEEIYNILFSMQASKLLHNEIDIAEVEISTKWDFDAMIARYNAAITAEQNRCRNNGRSQNER